LPIALQPRLAFWTFALRSLTFAVGSLGLAWGIANFAKCAAADDFLDLEARLLRFENYDRITSSRMLEDADAEGLSPCDMHAQRALLLLEMPLAYDALRSGTVNEYDSRIRSIEDRVRRTLRCSPRNSFVWLAAFALETQHGILNQHTFDLIAMSYKTSPNEAWLGIRRVVVAVPTLLVAPEGIKQSILTEFQDLVRLRFIELPARAYMNASEATRALLRSRIEQLDPQSKRAFSDALQKLRS